MKKYKTDSFRKSRLCAPISVFLMLALLLLAWTPAAKAQSLWWMSSALPGEDPALVQLADAGNIDAQVELANNAFTELKRRLNDPKLEGGAIAC